MASCHAQARYASTDDQDSDALALVRAHWPAFRERLKERAARCRIVRDELEAFGHLRRLRTVLGGAVPPLRRQPAVPFASRAGHLPLVHGPALRAVGTSPRQPAGLADARPRLRHAAARAPPVDGRVRRRLERVCRYLLRPPFALDAVQRTLTGGTVHFKKPDWFGATFAP